MLLEILDDLGPDRLRPGPRHPLVEFDADVEQDHAIDERGAQSPDQRPVLDPVAGRDDPGPRRQRMLADPAFEEQRVERLLDVGSAGGELVEEEAKRRRLLRQQHPRRTEDGTLADDPRDAADVFGRDLGADERPAGKPRIGGRLVDAIRLADAWAREKQDALAIGHRAEDRLRLSDRDGFASGELGHEVRRRSR